MKLSTFVEVVTSVGRYIDPDKDKDKDNTIEKEPIGLKHWCNVCKVYCCIKH